MRGVFMCGSCWLLAAPFARIYGEPELARSFPVAGKTPLVEGFRSPRLFLTDRRLTLRQLLVRHPTREITGILRCNSTVKAADNSMSHPLSGTNRPGKLRRIGTAGSECAPEENKEVSIALPGL